MFIFYSFFFLKKFGKPSLLRIVQSFRVYKDRTSFLFSGPSSDLCVKRMSSSKQLQQLTSAVALSKSLLSWKRGKKDRRNIGYLTINQIGLKSSDLEKQLHKVKLRRQNYRIEMSEQWCNQKFRERSTRTKRYT